MTNPWRCPNGTCPHPGMLHDRYDDEDPYPTCCAEGCRCGHPGDVTLQQDADGTVTVLAAAPVLLVGRARWVEMGEPLDDPFALDAAGKYVYRYLRPAEDGHGGVIIGRVR